jgi:hypothetical protein
MKHKFRKGEIIKMNCGCHKGKLAKMIEKKDIWEYCILVNNKQMTVVSRDIIKIKNQKKAKLQLVAEAL